MLSKCRSNNIALIAGSGKLPEVVYETLTKNNIKLLVIGFEGIRYNLLKPDFIVSLFSLRLTINILLKHNITDLAICGAVKFPNLPKITQLKLTELGLVNFMYILRYLISSKNKGDNGLLMCIERISKHYNMNIIGINDIVPEIIADNSSDTNVDLCGQYEKDIKLGIEALRHLSHLDIGQSIVVQNGRILGIEAAEGTDELIKRIAAYRSDAGRKPILVKMSKINQTKQLDLPTIGLDTMQNLRQSGFAGVVVERGSTIILEKEQIRDFAIKNSMFIKSVNY